MENDEFGEACVMKVYMNVLFSKKTMWRGKVDIVSRICYDRVQLYLILFYIRSF